MYFFQYFLSHVPFIGFFLLNNFYSDILLSFKLLILHEQFSKYLFVGSIGASLGRVLLEIYSDLCCMMEQDQAAAGQPENPIQPPQNINASFNIINGRYIITDPTGVAPRGYIDPQTRRPYATAQPYLSNLLAALENDVRLHGGSTVTLHSSRWGHVEWRFLSEYMGYNYPNRASHQWWNSKAIRDAIRRAP
jgi:hypothetical protein